MSPSNLQKALSTSLSFRFETRPMTTTTTTVESLKRETELVSEFNITVHEITKHFTD